MVAHTSPADVLVLDCEDPQLAFETARQLSASGLFKLVEQPRPGTCVASSRGGVVVDRPGVHWIEPPAVIDDSIVSALQRAPATPGLLQQIEGDFAFVALAAAGGVVVARSCGGRVPVYLAHGPGFLLAGTRLADVFRFAPRELSIDPLVNAIWATGHAIFPDRRTFLKDVTILPRGEMAQGSWRGVRSERYWDPRPRILPRPSPTAAAEHASRLRDILLGHLERHLPAESEHLLTLSGGVDSSAIAALIAGKLKRPLATLTFLAPPENPARARQLQYIEPLLDGLGVYQRLTFQASESALAELMSRPLTPLFHCPHPALRLLPSLSPFGTLTSGHFADESCGYSQRLQDWVHHTALSRALFGPPVASRLRDLGRWLWRRAQARWGEPLLPIPRAIGGVMTHEVDAELREWSDRTRRRLLSDERPLRELAALVELDGWVAMHWEATSPLGTVPVHPFFNREILELAFACHPDELFGPGTKKILRRALTELVPARNLHRPDKGHWHTPPPRAYSSWSGELGPLEGCVREGVAMRADLSSPWRRQLEQLRLFNERLNRERKLRNEAARPSH